MSENKKSINSEILFHEFKISELEDAINLAIKNKEQILLYPKNMNLIVVDIYREEQEYLKHTAIFNYNHFDTEEEFINTVKEKAEYMYENKDTEI